MNKYEIKYKNCDRCNKEFSYHMYHKTSTPTRFCSGKCLYDFKIESGWKSPLRGTGKPF